MLGVEVLACETPLGPGGARSPQESSTSSFRFTIAYALTNSPLYPSLFGTGRQAERRSRTSRGLWRRRKM